MSYWANRRVLVTGASGFVGHSLSPLLQSTGCSLFTPSHGDYDLLEQEHVRAMFRDIQPQVVFHLAALSGGIMANKKSPATYCYQNLMMGTMVIHEAWAAGVEKYVALMGGCSYPATAPSPIKETELWNGYPQPESAGYSMAKAMGHELAKHYRKQHDFNAIVLVPGNLYGPHDNYDLLNSHVIPAQVRKFYEAERDNVPEIVAWGSGKPVRDFIYVGDACEAIVRAAEAYNGPDLINISSGVPTTIGELIDTIVELTGYSGKVVWDTSKPDGQMFKGFDVTRMKTLLGYECPTSLREGLKRTIDWFSANYENARLEVPV